MSNTLKNAMQATPGYFWLGEPLIVYKDNTKVWSDVLTEDVKEDGLPAARVWFRTDGKNAAYNGEYTVIFSVNDKLTHKVFSESNKAKEVQGQVIESAVSLMVEDWTNWGQNGITSIQNAILEAVKNNTIYVSFSPDCCIDECKAGEELTYST